MAAYSAALCGSAASLGAERVAHRIPALPDRRPSSSAGCSTSGIQDLDDASLSHRGMTSAPAGPRPACRFFSGDCSSVPSPAARLSTASSCSPVMDHNGRLRTQSAHLGSLTAFSPTYLKTCRFRGRPTFRTRCLHVDADGPFLFRPCPKPAGPGSTFFGLKESDAGSVFVNQGPPSAGSPSSKPCSITKAFSSMLLMLKTLQSYALQMRSFLFFEDIQAVSQAVQREMQASFVWLFQQVFSCTPMLMVSVMLLFSDFTVHSAAANLCTMEMPEHVAVSQVCTSGVVSHPNTLPRGFVIGRTALESGQSSSASLAGASGGNGNTNGAVVSAFDDGDLFERHSSFGVRSSSREQDNLRWPFGAQTQHDIIRAAVPVGVSAVQNQEDQVALWKLLEATVRDMELQEGKPVVHLRLDQEVIRRLVAPVSITLDPDDYACFDRTDLEYQQAILEDAGNPMLLSNYAQFLFIVRRNYNRSEAYFHRALMADPTDGDILGRYATFLWLGRHDREGAERAYKTAMASDPENPYHTGSYAHFLWHSGDDETSCPVI